MSLDLVTKWTEMGLTVKMDTEKLTKLVSLYEDAANIFVIKDEFGGKFNDQIIGSVTFPIIYRVVKGCDLESEISIEDILPLIKNDFEKLTVKFTNDNFPVKVDAEAMAAAEISNIIIENIKNKTK